MLDNSLGYLGLRLVVSCPIQNARNTEPGARLKKVVTAAPRSTHMAIKVH